MNTFSDPAWSGQCAVQTFRYPQVSGAELDEAGVGLTDADVEARCRTAHLEGIRDGEAKLRKELEQSLEAERTAVTRAVQEFARERQQYYQRIEAEVVQLSLAIARKILHRESQVDPLLLAGVVRVALQNMAQGSTVRMRVHSDRLAAWQQHFESANPGGVRIDVVPDDSLDGYRCILETELGSSDIGLESQLKEIEKGFLDLLAQRPR